MSFGTGMCGICGKRIRWDDEFCSDECEREADRIREREELADHYRAAGWGENAIAVIVNHALPLANEAIV